MASNMNKQRSKMFKNLFAINIIKVSGMLTIDIDGQFWDLVYPNPIAYFLLIFLLMAN
jgi:hypothetical protein